MPKRRDFLKTAAAGLGGVAISGITSVEATAEQMKPGAAGRRGVLEVHVNRDIKLENLNDLFKSIGRMTGCVACGLGGIDLVIRQGRPEVERELGQIPNVEQATFLGR